MKKNILVALLLLSSLVVGQEDKGNSGGGIAIIYNALDKNTQAVNSNSNKIENMNEILQNQYQRWLGIYLFGTGVFMTFLYGLFGMINSYFRRRGLKKTEVLIEEQKKRIKEQDKNLMETLQNYKKTHEETQETLKKYMENIEKANKLAESVVLSQKTLDKSRNESIFIGFALGGGLVWFAIIILPKIIGGF